MKINKFLLIFATLYALAENSPFIVAQNIEEHEQYQEFEKSDVRFKSDARVLKKIILEYIALDGSQQNIVVDINKSIDWHNNYTLAKNSKADSVPMLDVSVTIPEQQIVDELNSSTTVEFPANNGKLEEFLSFANFNNKIKLNTPDEIIGDFVVGNPSKIVLDFKRDTAFETKNIKLGTNTPFLRMILGSHKGYYRLVIYMDGKYNYRIEKDTNGYTLYLI